MKSNLMLLVCNQLCIMYCQCIVIILNEKCISHFIIHESPFVQLSLLMQGSNYVLYSNVLFQLREILLEYQVSLNEQVRQAKYESARKVQKYYLKCLHQLVNGEAESMQLCTHTGIIQMFVVVNQVLAGVLNTSHLIPSRAEHLTHVKLQESLIIHTEDLSVVVILHRTFNR